MDSYAPACTFELAEAAARLSRESRADRPRRPGRVERRVLRPRQGEFARWKRVGHIGVEMEAAMIYTIAAVHGIEALAIMTVSDLLFESGETERISDEELKQGVDKMMRIACQVAVLRLDQVAPPLASATFCLPALIQGIIARSWAPTTSIGWCLPSSWRRL